MALHVVSVTVDSTDPLPLEQDLVDAVDPARYLLKPPRPMRGEDG